MLTGVKLSGLTTITLSTSRDLLLTKLPIITLSKKPKKIWNLGKREEEYGYYDFFFFVNFI